MTVRILVADDEAIVRDVVGRYLRRADYEVLSAATGPEALEQARQADLVILDLGLPEIDGLEVCRRIAKTRPVPVIMLTARAEEQDKLDGLGSGADDYMTKPFSPRELVARVQAVLRRTAGSGPEDSLDVAGLRMNLRERTVSKGSTPVQLTAREFDLLSFMAQSPRQVFSRSQLLENVWDYDFDGDESTVTVHIRRLREKIEADPMRPLHIKTVWGVGYKLEP
jgi:two-component system response regulator ResD